MQISEISSSWISRDSIAKLALVIRYALVVWLLYLVANFAWDYYQADEAIQSVPSKPVISALPNRKTPAPQASSLAGFHLFGEDKVGTPVAVQEAVPVDAPDTKLKLVLHGVLSIEDSERAQAIISNPAGKEDYYALGALLPGNATLESIHPDRVILKRLGRFETLRMPWESVVPGGKNSQRNSNRLPARRNSSTHPNFLPVGNTDQILHQLGASEYLKDGKIIGYKIENPEGYVLGSWGVKSNDIIVAINGVRLTGQEKIAAVMKTVSRSKNLKIDVLRKGKPMVLNRSK